MGGSGGGTGGYFSAHDAKALEERARRRLEQSRLESAVNSLLQQELPDINGRDTELINNRLQAIEQALGSRIGEVERLLFGGSVSKHTYVEGLSDIDALVEIAEEGISERSPAEVRDSLERALRQALPQGEVQDIEKGRIAVTVRYLDGAEIQLLPAVRVGDELAVSSWDSSTWVPIRPRDFASVLTATNQNQGGAVVPAIKLAKAIFANRLGDDGPTGYHVEALAVDAFRQYSGPRTPKAMVTHLVRTASDRVLRPIRDVSGQSRYVDESLGQESSNTRRALSRKLGRLARTMENTRSIDDWEGLIR